MALVTWTSISSSSYDEDTDPDDGLDMTCYIDSTDTAAYFEIDMMSDTPQTWADITDTRDTDISFVSCNPPWFAG